MSLFKLKPQFVEERRIALQAYLQLLLDNKEICQSDDLREFLCQREQKYGTGELNRTTEFGDITQDTSESSTEKFLLPKYVKTVSELSREAFQGVVKPFSEVINDLIAPTPSFSQQATGSTDPGAATKEDTTNRPAQNQSNVESSLYNTNQSENTDEPLYKPEGFTSLSEPLCNLIIELFEMKERSSFLRRQAVLLILQQILGGTIERKVTENIEWLVSEEMIVYYIDRFLQSWWPEGKLADNWPQRTVEQKEEMKKMAKQNLVTVLPEFFSSMIGSENSRRGGVRLFDAFQSILLNKHLMYTLFDEFVGAMFPEIERLNIEMQKSK